MFPDKYLSLNQNTFEIGDYKIIPIRYEDRFDIMKWRNEQIYHLRQTFSLTKNQQQIYFQQVVAKLFNEREPKQILFSFLKNNFLIGYGGLVHINWIDKHAEMSFLVDTKILNNETKYKESLKKYVKLITQVNFKELNFNKIYTETFDVRDFHVRIIEESGFVYEGKKREHVFFNGKYYNSLFHSILENEYYNLK